MERRAAWAGTLNDMTRSHAPGEPEGRAAAHVRKRVGGDARPESAEHGMGCQQMATECAQSFAQIAPTAYANVAFADARHVFLPYRRMNSCMENIFGVA